jgi:hypothetical protein
MAGCDWTKTMKESIRPWTPPKYNPSVEPVKPKIQNPAKIEVMIETSDTVIDEIDIAQLREYVIIALEKERDEFFLRNSAACKGKSGPEASQDANKILSAFDSAKVELKVLKQLI